MNRAIDWGVNLFAVQRGVSVLGSVPLFAAEYLTMTKFHTPLGLSEAVLVSVYSLLIAGRCAPPCNDAQFVCAPPVMDSSRSIQPRWAPGWRNQLHMYGKRAVLSVSTDGDRALHAGLDAVQCANRIESIFPPKQPRTTRHHAHLSVGRVTGPSTRRQRARRRGEELAGSQCSERAGFQAQRQAMGSSGPPV